VKSTYLLFRAYSLIVVAMFAILVAIMIANLNPKAESGKGEAKAAGDIIAHIVWPNGDTDVDIWMFGPDEPGPVGYSNKAGIIWNLLRDDRGVLPDATPINYEDAFTRGVVPGEYIINVQCFRCNLAQFPMTVDMGVSMRDRYSNDTINNIVTTKIVLKADGQEKTGVRFVVKEDGTVDMSSINNVYRKLVGNKEIEKKGTLTVPDRYIGGGMGGHY
jgi:hypothetical protein